ncbi:MAG: Txe/YoeB family addiction module toxin [Bacillota bacterium]|nr:Txe/YoeB family addiction module toxin [Bacillota bacterium]
MGTKRIQWDQDAWEDYLYWQTQDKKMLKRINQLIKDISRNPFEGIGKPEPLKGNLSGFWSRRIDEEHRLVYSVEEDLVLIFACRGHYDTL